MKWKIAVVYNGIIENFQLLKEFLKDNMKQYEEFIRFLIGMIIGLFVGPIIIGYMIILVVIDEFMMKNKGDIKNDK